MEATKIVITKVLIPNASPVYCDLCGKLIEEETYVELSYEIDLDINEESLRRVLQNYHNSCYAGAELAPTSWPPFLGKWG